MSKRHNSKNLLAKTILFSTAALGALFLPNQGYAQSLGDEDSIGMETILVTARRRTESLQDVPFAITAFDREMIERRNITELEDVARFTAGFAFEDFDGGNASPVIRGQTTLRTNALEQNVATFLDGIYMPRSWLVDLGTANVNRIEIVKGPQSARYGRNAFSGAINYVPLKAGGDTDIRLNATIGNYDRYDIGGTVALPIVEDKLFIRLAYDHTEFDGSWRNDHPNANAGFSPGTNGRVGGYNSETYSAHVLFTPTPKLSLEASYYGFDREDEARAARWFNTAFGIGNCGSLQGDGNFSLFCGELPETGDSTTIEPRGYGRQAQGDIFKAALAYDITDALNISYTFGHTQADTSAANTAEADPINCGTVIVSFATALCNFQGFPSGDVNYDQHELRLAFENEGPFRAVLGGFILDGVDDAFSVSANVPPGETRPVIISPVTTAPQPFPERFRNFVFGDQLTTTDVKAVFAEFTYTLPNQKTRLSAEGRFTSEKIAATNMAGFDDEETFEFFTPRITLEHDLSQDSLIYVTVGRGAKAGGFNSAAVSPELRTFDPEFNWTYEIGSKNVFLEGRLTVNAAAFYTDWNNQQINAGDPLGSPFTPTLTVNRGNATVYGFELETTFQATENLSFDGAFSYTNPTFDEGTFDVVFARGVDFLGFPAPCDDVVCSSDGDVSGNTLERNPKTQIALGAQWEAAISDTMDYYIRGDVGYQSSQFADSINAAIAPSRTVVNARAGVLVGQFEVAVWARNLFDEQYVANSFQIIQSFSNNLIGTYFGERRTFGVTAQYRY